MSPLTSPLIVGLKAEPCPIEAAYLTQLERTLDIPGPGPLKQETHPGAKVHANRIKLFPGLAAVAYVRGGLYAVASCDAILTAQALGGSFARVRLRPHAVQKLAIGGADLFCAVDLRAAATRCGPVVCDAARQPHQLSESRWPALRTSPNWCAPVTERGLFVCARCKAVFRSDRELFAHGGVPEQQQQRLREVLPAGWRPIPPGRSREPVPRANLECGSLSDRRHGHAHRHHLKARLLRLARPPHHHPYRIPLTRPVV